MSVVWIVGSDGAIGSACAEMLSHHQLQLMHSGWDVTRWESLESFAAAGQPGDEPPDALVYACGANHLDWSQRIDPGEMLYVYNVNVVGLVRCLQAAPSLNRVVVIGSDAARRPMRTSIAYNASKAALEAAVKVIARERASEGFTINVVAPGLVAPTAMTDYVYRETENLRPGFDLSSYMEGQIPAGRAATPREVARVVAWLVDDAPNYLNGSVIDVNGAR